jgi:hypothetical protein
LRGGGLSRHLVLNALLILELAHLLFSRLVTLRSLCGKLSYAGLALLCRYLILLLLSVLARLRLASRHRLDGQTVGPHRPDLLTAFLYLQLTLPGGLGHRLGFEPLHGTGCHAWNDRILADHNGARHLLLDISGDVYSWSNGHHVWR